MEGFRARTASSSQSSRRSSPTERLPPKDATKAKREYSGYEATAREPPDRCTSRGVRENASRSARIGGSCKSTCSPPNLSRARARSARSRRRRTWSSSALAPPLSSQPPACAASSPSRAATAPPPRRVPLFDAERVDFHAAAAELGITPAEFAARGLEPELVPHNLTFERRDRRRLNELDGWMDARATWYGGPSGPGPDGMSIYTGSCGYGQALGNHFISAWYDDHFPPRAAPRERPPRRTAVRRPTKSRRLEPTPTLPPLSSLISPSPVLDARPSHTAGTPTAGTTGA